MQRLMLWKDWPESSRKSPQWVLEQFLQWSQGLDFQKLFYNTIEDTAPNRKRREYFFINKNGHCIKVCAAFFLRTLGYSSNSVIKCLEKSSPAKNIFVHPDQEANINQPMLIVTMFWKPSTNIESFHPTCSRYRRSHAPLKRNLPPDVTVRYMQSLFRKSSEPASWIWFV